MYYTQSLSTNLDNPNPNTKIAFCKRKKKTFVGFSTNFKDILLAQNTHHVALSKQMYAVGLLNLLSMIIVIHFQLSRQPWSRPTSSEWPQITHFHTHTHTCSSHWSGFALATTFNFSISSILSFPSVPAQHSYWSRAVAPAPPAPPRSHTSSLPAALRTHASAQVRQLTAERGVEMHSDRGCDCEIASGWCVYRLS